MYKLLALDLDGTLLKNDKTISDKTFKAIEKARQKGVKVVLATGRPANGIKYYIDYLNLDSDDEFAITFNGSAVQTLKSGKLLFEKSLSGKDLKYLYKISRDFNVHIHAFDSTDYCITPVKNKFSELEANINRIALKEVDFDSYLDNDKIIKVLLVEEKEKLDYVEKNLPRHVYEKYSVMRSSPIFLEFLEPNTNKSTGIKYLSEILNIKREEIICMGDAGNDIHMIKYAGLGVAMENAFENVKLAADYVTKSNEEDGVAHVIEKFILNE
ncbi:Cof-type HAD-IIB family hydrolase [Clostridium oryzae]|nr:Cof-type HAD-IIB family hydrolase [Clostridium oryzae]